MNARQPVDPANTQLGVAKRVAGNIGYCLGLGPKSATRGGRLRVLSLTHAAC
jgi:hypothetical protein